MFKRVVFCFLASLLLFNFSSQASSKTDIEEDDNVFVIETGETYKEFIAKHDLVLLFIYAVRINLFLKILQKNILLLFIILCVFCLPE